MTIRTYTKTASVVQTLRGQASSYMDAHEALSGINGSWIDQFLLNGQWYVDRLMLVFDHTDIAPQKVLTSRMKVYPFKWADAPGVDYIIQTGLPDYPHYPLIAEDYDYRHYYGNKVAFHDSDVAINATAQALYFNVDPSWVRLGDYSRMVVRTSDDVNGNPVSNYTNFYFEGHSIIFGSEWPTLEITYEEGAIPQPPPNTCPKGKPFNWLWLLAAAAYGGSMGYGIRKEWEREKREGRV